MSRLCERPGCSTVAEVAYGFDRVARAVWLDAARGDDVNVAGALCRRHADAMVVPLGWALDDRREPVPRLFRSPADGTSPQRRPRRSGPKSVHSGDATVYQLPLGQPAAAHAQGTLPGAADDRADHDGGSVGEVERDATAWIPRFDTSDDLEGLLDAQGPLLSRAFTGEQRRSNS